MNPFSEQDGFLLDAHRYLGDEMSEVERQSFEALLAANPSAQDAFIDQVLLEAACHRIASEGSQAIQETSVRPALVSRSPVLVSSGGQTTAKDRSSRWDLSRTLAVVVTSCVMGVMIWGGGSALHELDSRRSFRDQLVTNDDVNAVGVWAELSADDSAAFNDDVDPDADADLMLSPLFVSAELDVPDWMFAAVEASSLMDDVNLEESPSDGGPL